MPPRKESPQAEPDEIAQLREEVADLKNYLRTLVDAIEDVREDLQYLNINGIRSREPLPPVPILKRMAADPCAEDWNDRLVIDRAHSTMQPGSQKPHEQPDSTSPSAPGKAPAGKLFVEPGDQSRLF